MAVARCEKCGPPQGMKLSYARSHKLAPDAKTRIFCGTGNCIKLALVCWLTDEEERQYLGGERRFAVPFRGRVRVT